MQKLVFRNADGVELNLTSDPFGITEWEGFSTDELNIQSQQVPFQDGGVYLDALLNERILSVTVAMNDGNNLEERYRLRRQMISALNPKNGEGVLIYTNDFLSKQIHCIPQLPVFENHNSNDSGTPKASCSFTACNPYWEDLEDTVVQFNPPEYKTITNNGDVPVGVEISVTGTQTTGVVIRNQTEDKEIEYEANLLEELSINTNTGKKSVVNKYSEMKLNVNEYENVIPINVIYSRKHNVYINLIAGGIIRRSTDGKNWENVGSVTSPAMGKVVYIEEKDVFVCIGRGRINYQYDNCTFAFSTDGGKTWTVNAYTWTNLSDVVYFPRTDKIIILANNGNGAVQSSDGVNWDGISLTGATQMYLMVYVKSEDVLYGIRRKGTANASAVYKSTDGVNFSTYTTYTGFSEGEYTNFLYSNELGYFLIEQRSDNKVTTTNNWSTFNEQVFSNYTVGFSFYNKYTQQFSVLLNKVSASVYTNCVYISNDGVNFNSIYEYKGYDRPFYAMIYNDKDAIYNIFDTYFGFLETKNFESIKYVQLPFGRIEKVIVGNNDTVFAGTTSSGIIYRKKNGSKYWENVNDVVTTNTWKRALICYKKSTHTLYIRNYAQGSAIVYTSTDEGETWESHSLSINPYYISYIEETDKFLCNVGVSAGTIGTSDDCFQWESNPSNISYQITSYAYNENMNLYIGVCNSQSDYVTSTDAQNWVAHTITGYTVRSIATSKKQNLFVALSGLGYILASKDGINWVLRTRPSNTMWIVIYNKYTDLFYCTGSAGTIWCSYDSIEWVKLIEVENPSHQLMSYYIDNLCYLPESKKYVGTGRLLILDSETVERNVINNLSKDSDINLKLEKGDNTIGLLYSQGTMTGTVSFRQKYVGV